MFGSFLPSALGWFGSYQSLLGYRSRHCHGINFTHNRVVGEIAEPYPTCSGRRRVRPPHFATNGCQYEPRFRKDVDPKVCCHARCETAAPDDVNNAERRAQDTRRGDGTEAESDSGEVICRTAPMPMFCRPSISSPRNTISSSDPATTARASASSLSQEIRTRFSRTEGSRALIAMKATATIAAAR